MTSYPEFIFPRVDGRADVVEAGQQSPQLNLDLGHGVAEVGEGLVVGGTLSLQLLDRRLVGRDVF